MGRPTQAVSPSEVAGVAYLETLGCPRNEVDSEKLAGGLARLGYEFTDDPVRADVVVLATCSFLSDARREAFTRLHELLSLKSLYPNKLVAAIGCLPEFLGHRGMRLFPGIDHWLGRDGWSRLPALIGCNGATPGIESSRITARRQYAYLKVSEGCSRGCRYCLIPAIKGPLRERPRQAILREAEELAEQGVSEVILVAQDTTACGGPQGLPGLLADLSQEGFFPWIRVLYAHPSGVGEELAEALATLPSVLPYLDMPIQHASPRILRRMGRWPSPAVIQRTIGMLRNAVPGIVLRTTVMVGFPGERRSDIQTLKQFLRDTRFDHVGVFAYSREPGTEAFGLNGRVDKRTRLARQREIVIVQQRLRRQGLRGLIGTVVEAIVEGRLRNGRLLCRPWWSAPEVDAYLSTRGSVRVGRRVACRITALGAGVDLEAAVSKVT
jgi:ribosomal protein S12 methylthiotransferase